MMSADHGSKQTQENEASGTSTLDFLKAFESIYMISTLKPINFESKSPPKRSQTNLSGSSAESKLISQDSIDSCLKES